MTYREDEKGHDTKIGGRKKSKRNGRDKVARKVRQVERKGMRWEKWRQNRRARAGSEKTRTMWLDRRDGKWRNREGEGKGWKENEKRKSIGIRTSGREIERYMYG